MKIAFISDAAFPYSKGGVEKRNWDMALELVRRGHEVHLITARLPNMQEKGVVDGVDIHGVGKVANLYVGGKRSIGGALRFCMCLIPHLLRHKYDVYACDQFPLLHIFPLKMMTWLRRKRLFLTWHEVWGRYWFVYHGWFGFVGFLIEKIVVSLPGKIISVSEQTTSALISVLHVDPGRIENVHNGIPFSMIDGVQASRDASDLIYVGRLQAHKNVDVLVEAMGILARRMPDTNLRCLVVGDGPERTRLERLAEEKNLHDRVVFKGLVERTEELYGLMKASRIFVLPSTREGFGITVIEANACGLPVITIDHPQNASRDLIREGISGWRVGLDGTALADKIVEALDKEDEMKSRCIESARQYDWAKRVDLLERIYLDLGKR